MVPGAMEPEAWEYEGGFSKAPDLIRWVDHPIE